MRAAFALAALAAGLSGSAAAAQESVSYSLDWIEVNAGTSVPVAVSSGTLQPGEGVRVRLSVQITPGIGSPATYQAPPAPGSGTIAGLGSIFFDLVTTNTFGGTWTQLTRAPGWALGGAGTPAPSGGIDAAGAGQFVLPGNVANSANPILHIWQGTWTPSSYAVRDITFQSMPALAGGPNHTSILIQYGVDPNTGDPRYVGRFVSGQFGNVVVRIPAPNGLSLLCISALAAARRRRRTSPPPTIQSAVAPVSRSGFTHLCEETRQ